MLCSPLKKYEKYDMPMNSKKTSKNITDNVFMIFPKRSFIMLHFYLYNQLLQWFRNFWAIGAIHNRYPQRTRGFCHKCAFVDSAVMTRGFRNLKRRMKSFLLIDMGPCTNHGDRILGKFDPPPPM